MQSLEKNEDIVRLYLVHTLNRPRKVIPTDDRNYVLPELTHRLNYVNVMKDKLTPADSDYNSSFLKNFSTFFVLPDPNNRDLTITDAREHEVLNSKQVHRDVYDAMQGLGTLEKLDDFLLSVFSSEPAVKNASKEQMRRLMRALEE